MSRGCKWPAHAQQGACATSEVERQLGPAIGHLVGARQAKARAASQVVACAKHEAQGDHATGVGQVGDLAWGASKGADILGGQLAWHTLTGNQWAAVWVSACVARNHWKLEEAGSCCSWLAPQSSHSYSVAAQC